MPRIAGDVQVVCATCDCHSRCLTNASDNSNSNRNSNSNLAGTTRTTTFPPLCAVCTCPMLLFVQLLPLVVAAPCCCCCCCWHPSCLLLGPAPFLVRDLPTTCFGWKLCSMFRLRDGLESLSPFPPLSRLVFCPLVLLLGSLAAHSHSQDFDMPSQFLRNCILIYL